MSDSSEINRIPDLIPSVKRKTFRCHDPKREQADAEYVRNRLGALKNPVYGGRAYTCLWCGFTSRPKANQKIKTRVVKVDPGSFLASGYMEIHHADDNHANNAAENLLVGCPYCHQVFHCGHAGFEDKFHVVWFPELEQRELNNLVHALFAAIDIESAYAEKATRLYRTLEARSELVRVRFSGLTGLARSEVLGLAISGLAKRSEDLYQNRNRVLSPLRLLPSLDAYQGHRKYWADEVWKSLPPDSWQALYREWIAKA